MSDKSFLFLINKLWSFLTSQRKKHFLLLLIFIIFSSFAEVVSIGAIFPFLAAITSPDKLFNNELFLFFFSNNYFDIKDNVLFYITILFCCIILLSGLIRMILWWLQTRICFGAGADFSYEIYKRTLYQPYEVHLSRNSSEVISGISNKVGSIIYSIILPLLTVFSSLLMILFIGSVLFFVDPYITVSSIIVFGFIYMSITYFSKNRINRDSKIIASESNFVFKALQEGLAGIRDVILDGSQQVYLEIYRNSDLPLRRAQGNIHLQSGLPRYFVETLGYIFIGLLAYFLAKNSSNPNVVVARLAVVAIGAQRLLPVIQQLYSSLTIIRGAKSNLIDVIDLLSQKIQNSKPRSKNNDFIFTDNINFNNIFFKYSETEKFIFSDISFDIFKGERVGIIGTTGCGKTTLLDLIMGLLAPTSGDIIVDGVPLNSNNLEYWRENIAHVPQNIFLSDATIFENIAFGIPFADIDHNQVIEAAKQAKIYDTIMNMQYGFKTSVGERGIRLSGGQRQRIGIARALYKKATIIIFDEATSALDNSTESELMQEIDDLDSSLTLILVAHRLSTLKSCNVIFEISNGKINRLGDYNSLSHS
jgi:ABC-type bacteriocin/lantibiotic exporter with double-glycine peptidase domain